MITWKTFMAEACPDAAQREMVRVFVRDLLMSKRPERILFMVGPPRSGKSVFARVLQEVLEDIERKPNTNLRTLDLCPDISKRAPTPVLADIAGTSLLTLTACGPEDHERDAVSVIKQLHGQDNIYVRRPHAKNSHSFRYKGGILIISNQFFEAYESDAIKMRCNLVVMQQSTALSGQDLFNDLPLHELTKQVREWSEVGRDRTLPSGDRR
jgi:phage/plasmid-associated DNA primase